MTSCVVTVAIYTYGGRHRAIVYTGAGLPPRDPDGLLATAVRDTARQAVRAALDAAADEIADLARR